jgi:hypothetical protein
MNTTPKQSDQNPGDEDLSRDAVWDLLRQSPAPSVSSGFADRVILAAREADRRVVSFWSRTRAVAASVAAMAAAAVIAAAWVFLPDRGPTIVVHQPDSVDAFASLDEVAHQEMLLAATDHLGDFSDTELVTLIGF